MITIERKIHINVQRRGRKAMQSAPKPAAPPNPPRIAVLMALAIHFDEMIRTGEVADYADLARREGVTRARVTQIMNLLLLAPTIQSDLLHLDPAPGRAPVILSQLQEIAAEPDWKRQVRMFSVRVKSM